MPRPCTCERRECKKCFLYRTSEEHRYFWDTGEILYPTRLELCVWIRKPVNTVPGCSTGYRCQQVCTSKNPDVLEKLSGLDVVIPGDECQKCPGYEFPAPVSN